MSKNVDFFNIETNNDELIMIIIMKQIFEFKFKIRFYLNRYLRTFLEIVDKSY